MPAPTPTPTHRRTRYGQAARPQSRHHVCAHTRPKNAPRRCCLNCHRTANGLDCQRTANGLGTGPYRLRQPACRGHSALSQCAVKLTDGFDHADVVRRYLSRLLNPFEDIPVITLEHRNVSILGLLIEQRKTLLGERHEDQIELEGASAATPQSPVSIGPHDRQARSLVVPVPERFAIIPARYARRPSQTRVFLLATLPTWLNQTYVMTRSR